MFEAACGHSFSDPNIGSDGTGPGIGKHLGSTTPCVASEGFSAVVEDIRQLVDVDVPALQSRLEAMGIRWTTGRGVPSWSR